MASTFLIWKEISDSAERPIPVPDLTAREGDALVSGRDAATATPMFIQVFCAAHPEKPLSLWGPTRMMGAKIRNATLTDLSLYAVACIECTFFCLAPGRIPILAYGRPSPGQCDRLAGKYTPIYRTIKEDNTKVDSITDDESATVLQYYYAVRKSTPFFSLPPFWLDLSASASEPGAVPNPDR